MDLIVVNDLQDFLLTFDKRVLVTDLMDKYMINYKSLESVLLDYMKENEAKGIKYKKQYLVHGYRKDPAPNQKREVFVLANDKLELENMLSELDDTKHFLYSVQITGGAKAPAQELKPLKFCKVTLENSPRCLESTNVNGHTNGNYLPRTKIANNDKREEKVATEVTKKLPTTKDKKLESKSVHSFFSASSAKASTSKESIFKEKPGQSKKINNSIKTGADKKSENNSKSNLKQATPKKMGDFFKNPTMGKLKKEEQSPGSTSMQLFYDDQESSDEEEKSDSIRRNMMSTDHVNEATPKIKRQRIIDSEDDEEEPQQKHEKKKKIEVVLNAAPDLDPSSDEVITTKCDDDDDYTLTVIQKKPDPKVIRQVMKQVNAAGLNKPSRSPSKDSSSENSKPTGNKTKQKNITSFFSKK